jgi:hypothetical protein
MAHTNQEARTGNSDLWQKKTRARERPRSMSPDVGRRALEGHSQNLLGTERTKAREEPWRRPERQRASMGNGARLDTNEEMNEHMKA